MKKTVFYAFIMALSCVCSQLSWAGNHISISTSKGVYVQKEPIYIKAALTGLPDNTTLNLAVSLKMPSGEILFMGGNGMFGRANSLWLITNWPYSPFNVADGALPLMVAPDISMTPGEYRLRIEIYAAYTNVLIDYDESVFYLITAPYLDRIEPSKGITGDVLKVVGQGFGNLAAKVKIFVGGREATPMDVADDTIYTWVPYGAVSGQVQVSVDGALSNPVNFIVGPYIDSVSANIAAPGDKINVKGFNFDADKNRNYVYFNGIRGTVNTATATQLNVTVPDGNTGPLTVSANDMSSKPVAMTIIPVMEAVTPAFGETGQTVVISGKNFSPVPSNNYVVFNAGATSQVAAAVMEATTTTLLVRAPASETGKVLVYTDGQAAKGALTFTYPPAVDAVTPTEIVAGDTVVITGRNFDATAAKNTVVIGDETLTILSSTTGSISARLPLTAVSGPLKVIVNGVSSKESLFVTVYDTPKIQSISPSSISVASSGEVVVTGAGFLTGAAFQLTSESNVVTTLTVTLDSYSRARFKLPKGLTSGTYQLTVKRTINGRTLTSNSVALSVTP